MYYVGHEMTKYVLGKGERSTMEITERNIT
jgi:hypothetical protein